MRLTYDPEVNAAYIQLRSKGAHVTTIAVTPDCNVDITSDGKVFGIELLDAKKQLSLRKANKITVENQQTGKKLQLPMPF